MQHVLSDEQPRCAEHLHGRQLLRQHRLVGGDGSVHGRLVLSCWLVESVADRVSAWLVLRGACERDGGVSDWICVSVSRHGCRVAVSGWVVLPDDGSVDSDRLLLGDELLSAGLVERDAERVHCGQLLSGRSGRAGSVHGRLVLQRAFVVCAGCAVSCGRVVRCRHERVCGVVLSSWLLLFGGRECVGTVSAGRVLLAGHIDQHWHSVCGRHVVQRQHGDVDCRQRLVSCWVLLSGRLGCAVTVSGWVCRLVSCIGSRACSSD